MRCPCKGGFSVLFDEENCLGGSPFSFWCGFGDAVRFIVLYYPYNFSVYLHPQKKTQHCAKVSDFPADITYRMFDGITMPAQQICKSYGGEFYGDQKTVSCSERLPRKFV